jgi:hypothetical protein
VDLGAKPLPRAQGITQTGFEWGVLIGGFGADVSSMGPVVTVTGHPCTVHSGPIQQPTPKDSMEKRWPGRSGSRLCLGSWEEEDFWTGSLGTYQA